MSRRSHREYLRTFLALSLAVAGIVFGAFAVNNKLDEIQNDIKSYQRYNEMLLKIPHTIPKTGF